jgi:hypothetical protein
MAPPAQGVPQPAFAVTSGPQGVGGWLLLFCVIVTILGPLGSIGEIMWLGFAPNPVRLIRLVPSAYGMVVGILLWMRRAVALHLLRIYFILVAAFAILGVLRLALIGLRTGWDPMLLSPSFTPALVQPGYIILWFSYFHKSRRVSNTYGANL